MPVELPKGLWFELKEPTEHLFHQNNTPSSARCGKPDTPRQQFTHMGMTICYLCADERVDELRMKGVWDWMAYAYVEWVRDIVAMLPDKSDPHATLRIFCILPFMFPNRSDLSSLNETSKPALP